MFQRQIHTRGNNGKNMETGRKGRCRRAKNNPEMGLHSHCFSGTRFACMEVYKIAKILDKWISEVYQKVTVFSNALFCFYK